jgi:antiviral helicase SKI2
LGYISEDNAVALKGRVAAEISTTEELILTELLFEGVLGDLSPAEAVALLSALVFQVRTPPTHPPTPPPSHTHLVHRLEMWAARVAVRVRCERV